MQILNTGDHWVCATNVFTADPNVVYWFTSVPGPVNLKEILKLSSILRCSPSILRSAASDTMTIHSRAFDRQPFQTRSCGYYAMAAAISAANGIDPTAVTYDFPTLIKVIDSGLQSGRMELVPVANSHQQHDVQVIVAQKMYCFCCKPSVDLQMLQCCRCMHRFHYQCVPDTHSSRLAADQFPVALPNLQWCSKSSRLYCLGQV